MKNFISVDALEPNTWLLYWPDRAKKGHGFHKISHVDTEKKEITLELGTMSLISFHEVDNGSWSLLTPVISLPPEPPVEA